jgi:hypothetical protein
VRNRRAIRAHPLCLRRGNVSLRYGHGFPAFIRTGPRRHPGCSDSATAPWFAPNKAPETPLRCSAQRPHNRQKPFHGRLAQTNAVTAETPHLAAAAALFRCPGPDDRDVTLTVERSSHGMVAARQTRMIGSFCSDAVLFGGHRSCHHQRLLKLEVCIIWFGWIELREILRRLVRNLLGDRR